jgi:hypothetical protein
MPSRPGGAFARSGNDVRKLAVALFSVCTLGGRVATGGEQPPSAEPTEHRSAPLVVRVAVVGAELGESFGARIQSWFRPPTRVVLSHAPTLSAEEFLGAVPEDTVKVSVDLRAPEQAQVYLVVSRNSRERCLMRDVVLGEGLDEVGQEQLAQLVFSSVLAVWEGSAESSRSELEQRLGVATEPARSEPGTELRARAPAPPPAPADVPRGLPSRASSASLFAYSLRVGYGTSFRGGPEGLAHGPELWGTLYESHGRHSLGGFLRASYLVPVETTTAQLLELELAGARLRMGLSYARVLADAFGLETGAGVGTDIFHFRPRVPPPLRAQAAETEVRPVASLHLGCSILAGQVRVVPLGTVDFQLERTRYRVARNAGQQVFEPWLVQPGFVLLFAWVTGRP